MTNVTKINSARHLISLMKSAHELHRGYFVRELVRNDPAKAAEISREILSEIKDLSDWFLVPQSVLRRVANTLSGDELIKIWWAESQVAPASDSFLGIMEHVVKTWPNVVKAESRETADITVLFHNHDGVTLIKRGGIDPQSVKGKGRKYLVQTLENLMNFTASTAWYDPMEDSTRTS